MVPHLTEELREALLGGFIEVDEDEPFPDVTGDRGESVIFASEAGVEEFFVLDSDQTTAVVVGPSVEAASKDALSTELLELVFGNNDGIPAV